MGQLNKKIIIDPSFTPNDWGLIKPLTVASTRATRDLNNFLKASFNCGNFIKQIQFEGDIMIDELQRLGIATAETNRFFNKVLRELFEMD
jgi:hypothetical protein